MRAREARLTHPAATDARIERCGSNEAPGMRLKAEVDVRFLDRIYRGCSPPKAGSGSAASCPRAAAAIPAPCPESVSAAGVHVRGGAGARQPLSAAKKCLSCCGEHQQKQRACVPRPSKISAFRGSCSAPNSRAGTIRNQNLSSFSLAPEKDLCACTGVLPAG